MTEHHKPPIAAEIADTQLKRRRNQRLAALGGVVVLGAVGVTAYWALYASHFVSTDNAYAAVEVAAITPAVGGTVAEVPAKDTQTVKKGDVLVQIDRTDARLALANQAARHQGFHPAGFDLLHHARQGNMQANAISAGLVCLNGAQTPLKDLLCLVQGDQYLLYAPGAPGGDFHLFDSLQEMALEIGSWTLWPVGSEYLLGQCSRAQHDSLKRHLRKVEMLPTDWSMHCVTLAPIKSQQWLDVLNALARRKITALIEDQQATTPSWFINASRAEQQALVDIDQLLKLAQANPFTHAVEAMRFAMYGQLNALSWAVVLGCGAAFFALALWGYDPQRGFIRQKGGG